MKEWHKIDLHIHAEHGITFDRKVKDKNPNFYNLKNMLKRNELNDLSLVALTEHNMINVVNNLKLSYVLEKEGKTNSLPGVEIDLCIKENRYHIIVIFSKRVNIIDISFKISTFIKNKTINAYLTLDEFLKVIINTECIIIPHACKKTGLKPGKDDDVSNEIAVGIIDVLRSGNFINFLFEHTKQYFKGSFAKSVIENASVNWISEDELVQLNEVLEAGIAGSDFRFNTENIEVSEKDFSAIWAAPTFRGLELVCLFPENRILMFDQIIEKHNYISQIQIEGNQFFGESNIRLSSGLNSIIGSSASGKTALLHIIANKISGKNIKDKKYSFTDNLKVNFFDKDNNPINKGDIKIEVADSLYDKIAKIHESDIKGILNLFDYKVNQESQVINSYENSIKNYINLDSKFLDIFKGLNENIQKLNENTKNYILNVKGKQKGISQFTIVNGSSGKIKTQIDELLSIVKTFKEMTILIVDLRNKYNDVKFVLEKHNIKNEIQTTLTQLELEIKMVKKKLNLSYYNLKKDQVLQSKINNIISDFNANIGQKSEYIQRLNNNIVSSKDEIINQLRNLIVLEIRKDLIDISFPIEQICDELSKSNKNEYLDLDVVVNYDIFLVANNSGIIEYEKNSLVLKEYKDSKVFDSTNLKKIIRLILSKSGKPIFRRNELIESLIENSKLKLGYPNKEKLNIEDVSPGDASKIYIDYKFKTDFKNGNFNVVVFDQPENDVDKEFIYQELLKQINDLKHETQVVLTSHDPLIVINGDSNRIINAKKTNKLIHYYSTSLEEYESDKPITSLVSRFVDGNELAVKKRYELYTGGNAKW